jgi:hypothetical protein
MTRLRRRRGIRPTGTVSGPITPLSLPMTMNVAEFRAAFLSRRRMSRVVLSLTTSRHYRNGPI